MNVVTIMPEMCYRVGQAVIERWGNSKDDAQTCEAIVVERKGRIVTLDNGNKYDALTGAAVPKGSVYRSIRAVTETDKFIGGLGRATPIKPAG